MIWVVFFSVFKNHYIYIYIYNIKKKMCWANSGTKMKGQNEGRAL